MRLAIIGAGMAGLTAARRLHEHHDVVLFDKSRGVGGRMSTRYAGDYEFDHGAQYFTVSDPEFERVVNDLAEQDAAARWESRGLYMNEDGTEPDTGRPRWVGTTRMNAVPKALAHGLDVRSGRRVMKIEGQSGDLNLTFEDGTHEGPFDRVICTAPAPQAAAMLPDNSPLQAVLKTVRMHACFALMVGLDEAFDSGWDSLRINGLPISWIARNGSKPGRGQWPTLVLHAAPDWSDRHAQSDPGWVRDQLLDCGSALTGLTLQNAPHIALHRWLYAYSDSGVGSDCLVDPEAGIILAGDWCLGGRVEGAFISGRAAAKAVFKTQSA